MATDSINTESIIGEKAADFVRYCEAVKADQLAGIRALHDAEPLEFAERRQAQIRRLLALLATNSEEMCEPDRGDLLWLACELTQEVEFAIDLVTAPQAAEGDSAR
jgi:hypothetical protein